MKDYLCSGMRLRCLLPAGMLMFAWALGASAMTTATTVGTTGQVPPPPVAATLDGEPVRTRVEHVQKNALTPAQLMPHRNFDSRPQVDYDRPAQMSSRAEVSRLRAMAEAATCEIQDFVAASGNDLVTLVQSVPVTCLNNLYDLTGSQAAGVFAEDKMVTIANAMQAASPGYPGDNTTQMLQLITFLRAGYYVQYNLPTVVGDYGASLQGAIRSASDAFIASPHFTDVSNAHGDILAEFVTLIDSSVENGYRLPVLKDLLDRFDSSYYDFASMRRATNNVFTVIYLGHYRTGFAAAAQADPSIITSLAEFVSRNDEMAGTSNEYMLVNSANEMARFMQYPSLLSTVRPLAKAVLDSYSLTGRGSAIYAGVASMVDYYDGANCDYYGICNFIDDLADAVLPIEHSCSPSVHMRAQALTADEIESACTLLLGETDYFHDKVKSNKVPVADDYNTELELVIFDSSADYKKYAGTLFGISTDNGGMYLEGNPANPNNTARFIAHRAEWLPEFSIWNLTHEYIHYLDGRFNMWGDFGASTSSTTIWWVEGFAEYISYSYRNMLYPEAIAAAGTGQFPLSTIFGNSYNNDSARVYYWGYLAARYMFERHPGQVDNILSLFRAGKYAQYGDYLESIRYASDDDWSLWLTCLSANGGDSSTCGDAIPEPPMDVVLNNDIPLGGQSGAQGDELIYKLTVPAKATSLVLRTMGGSGDVSLYLQKDSKPTITSYSHKSARAGNNESIVIAKPEAGTYYMLVTGEAAFSGVTVHARYKAAPLPPSLPECGNSDERVFDANCQRSDLSGPTSTNPRYFYYYVPANTAKVTIASMGGTGNVDLYAGSNWATTTVYDHKSTGPDNSEEIVIENPEPGYLYFSLIGTEAYSGAQLRLMVE